MANERYESTVKVQASRYTGGHPMDPVRRMPQNTPRDIMKQESMKRAAIRQNAIKSENFKEPLIKCPACGMKLEVGTEECPNCCRKLKNKMDDNKRTVILLIIALIIFLIPFFKTALKDEGTSDDIGSFFSEMSEAFDDFMDEV